MIKFKKRRSSRFQISIVKLRTTIKINLYIMREIEKWWFIDSAIELFFNEKVIKFTNFLTKSSVVDCSIEFTNFLTKSLINDCRNSSINDLICLIVLLKIELSFNKLLRLIIITKRENYFFNRIELSITNKIIKIFWTSDSFVRKSLYKQDFSIMINHIASIICHEYK